MSPQELRLARESLNLTQTELATKIGVSLRTLQEWEKTKIPETKIAQVVKVLSESRMDDKLERLQKAVDALKYLGVFKTQQDAANQMLMSRPNFSAALNGSEKYFTENFLDRFLSVFGNTISSGWLLTGEGEMLIGDGSKMPLSPPPSNIEEIKSFAVPLLPLDAIGGRLDGFAPNGGTISQCETIASPFKNAALAIRVKGQSMSPLYPSGCVLFIVKNNGGWLDWGKVYVLDTDNGVIVKQLSPSQKGENFICCISFNNSPEYAPFDIPRASIYGIYRVLSAMTEL